MSDFQHREEEGPHHRGGRGGRNEGKRNWQPSEELCIQIGLGGWGWRLWRESEFKVWGGKIGEKGTSLKKNINSHFVLFFHGGD